MTTKPKDSTRKILTPLDDQLDDSFPASDPPSLTDPSRTIKPQAEERDDERKDGGGKDTPPADKSTSKHR